ncbi:MAG: hydrogenase maturation nickel metallochaperone HypA [Alphaproteobacteria bacterium]|nr:hydrogenase maturation nickel metallochaperone HypA [Alphaproteobacteria bacterium]TAD89163.1 MAG: hydrogenase maturation nickel metallochaperone HypA [Alphaproteobacteria bacterium]
MHEMALAQGIVDLVADHVRGIETSGVRWIKLEIGALSHVDPHALRFCFDSVAHGTRAEGAALVIDEPPGRGRCMACGSLVTIARRGDGCPACGSGQVLTIDGDQMRVVELEVL